MDAICRLCGERKADTGSEACFECVLDDYAHDLRAKGADEVDVKRAVQSLIVCYNGGNYADHVH